MKKICEQYLNFILIFLFLGITACAQKPFPSSQGHLEAIADTKTKESVRGNIPEPVLSHTLLPPPRRQKPEELFTVVVHDLPVNELLFALARDAKINVDIAPGITGNVSLNAIDQTLPQILERLKRQIDLRYKIEAGTLIISPDSAYFVQYSVPYINLSRLSINEVSISTQVSSTGGAAGTESNGSSDSSTIVKSTSQYMFWETLLANLKAILRNNDSIRDTKQKIGSDEDSTGKDKVVLENNIIAHQETGIVAIRASEKQHAEIRKYIDNVIEHATRQVLIEATIVEVALNDNYQTGIDWSILNQGQLSLNDGSFVENLVISATTKAVPPAAIAIAGNDIVASIRMLETFGNSRVLSSPKLMVLNNQTAILKVVENIVYFTTKVQTDVTDGVISKSFETELHTVPVGLVMTVQPQISDNDQIIISARPTISRISKFVQDPHPELTNIVSEIPQIEVREMESILTIDDAEIGVIGGLMSNTTDNVTEGTPGLSKIPFLDNVFGYKKRITQKTELVVFLRPRIIRSASIKRDLKDFTPYLNNQSYEFEIPEIR